MGTHRSSPVAASGGGDRAPGPDPRRGRPATPQTEPVGTCSSSCSSRMAASPAWALLGQGRRRRRPPGVPRSRGPRRARLSAATGSTVSSPRTTRHHPGAGQSAMELAEEMGDEYVATEHLLLALAASTSPVKRRSPRRRDRAGDARGDHRGPRQPHGDQPGRRGVLRGAGEVRRRPHRARRGGQARPGDRPRRRDPPGDPGAVPAHEEQPGAHRRARRRQDRRRGGSGPAHRRRRRARLAQGARGCSASTWPRWWPVRSTAASSRSGSRPCSRRSRAPRVR